MSESLPDLLDRLDRFAAESSVDLARIAAAAAMIDLFDNWRDAIDPEVGDPSFGTREMLGDIRDVIAALREYADQIEPKAYGRLTRVV